MERMNVLWPVNKAIPFTMFLLVIAFSNFQNLNLKQNFTLTDSLIGNLAKSKDPWSVGRSQIKDKPSGALIFKSVIDDAQLT